MPLLSLGLDCSGFGCGGGSVPVAVAAAAGTRAGDGVGAAAEGTGAGAGGGAASGGPPCCRSKAALRSATEHHRDIGSAVRMEVLQKGKGWEGAKLTFLAQSGHRAQSEVCGRFALLIGVPPKSRGPRRPIDVSTHTRQAQPGRHKRAEGQLFRYILHLASTAPLGQRRAVVFFRRSTRTHFA